MTRYLFAQVEETFGEYESTSKFLVSLPDGADEDTVLEEIAEDFRAGQYEGGDSWCFGPGCYHGPVESRGIPEWQASVLAEHLTVLGPGERPRRPLDPAVLIEALLQTLREDISSETRTRIHSVLDGVEGAPQTEHERMSRWARREEKQS
jgi:hypothetical protein